MPEIVADNISIVQSNGLEGATRIESEYYNKPSLIDKNFIKGNTIIDHIQYGTSEELNEEFNGFPILRLNEFDGFFLDIPRKYCNKISKDVFNNLLLKKGDVLVCRTNGNPKLVGKSAIVMEDINIAFASYLFRIKTKISSITPITLSVYLNSKIGRREIERNLMVSNQSNFSPATLRDIKIPIFPQEFQKLMDDIVTAAYHNHKDSKLQYSQAETLLLEELGLKDFNLIHEPCYEVNYYDSITANRIDAEYYQPKYEKAIKMITGYPFKPLGDLFRLVKGIEPGSSFYSEEGKTFIRVSNLNKFEINNNNQQYLSEDTYNALKPYYQPFKGEILLSKDATPGIAYHLKEEIEGIISGGILRLQPLSEIKKEYICLVINSLVGQSQIERDSGGSVIYHWKPAQVKKTLIPILPDTIQEKIESLCIESFSARRRAKALLEEAKKKVEEMIEKGQG